jgi:hypothetical protein
MPRPTWPVVPVPVQGLGRGAELDQEVACGVEQRSVVICRPLVVQHFLDEG